MDFEKIVMMFTMQEPYYGILLSAMERIPKKEVGTLGVSRSGNVFRLYYNPDFINKFNIDTIISLLKHEILHTAFHHFTIWDGEDKDDTPQMHTLRNIACDLEINGYLDRSKVEKEAGGCWAEDFGWDKYLGVREYLKRLLAEAQQQQQQEKQQSSASIGTGGPPQDDEDEDNQNSQGNDNQGKNKQNQAPTQNQSNNQNGDDEEEEGEELSISGSDGSVSPNQQPIPQEFLNKLSSFDNHDDWPETDDDSSTEQMNQVIDDLLVFAAEETEKARGQMPGEMRVLVDKIRARKRARPVADWKRYFRRYMGNEFSEFIRKSRKRESKRFPDAAGNRHRRKSHILVAIDTSGSVSMPEYLEFFAQIKTLSQDATFHIVECDTRIAHEYDYRGKPNMVLHGGGGTSFQPPVDMFLKERRKYDALVYFTDGGAPIPSDTPKDTLWVISSVGDHNRKRYQVNGASVAIIQAKQQ